MGTQDDANIAGPQKEFLSGFKRGAVSHGKEKQSPSVPQPGKIGGGIASRKLSSGLQNQTGINPFQPAQQACKNTRTEQQSTEPSEKNDVAGLGRKVKTGFPGKEKESAAGSLKQKVMVVLIPILFIVMIFTFRQVLAKPPQKVKGDTGNNKKTASINKSSDAEIDWKIPDPLPQVMRDPIKIEESAPEIIVQETAPVQAEEGSINVKSILYSDDKPSVVIGNQLVYLNQKINGVTVVEIHKDYIVFEKEGKRWTQKVTEESSRSKKETIVSKPADTNMTSSGSN